MPNDNMVIKSDDSFLHTNSKDDGSHSVTQFRTGGDHGVIIRNGDAVNINLHADDGSHLHINTHGNSMHDGWAV